MNPAKLGKLDTHRQQPWKAPLPIFIEDLYLKRFGKERPDVILSIEELPGSRSFDWQKEFLDQRLKDAEEHLEDWVSWDKARQRLERQLHGRDEGVQNRWAYQTSRKVRRLSQ